MSGPSAESAVASRWAPARGAWLAGALAVIVGAAAFLRFYAIARQGFWYDEAQTGWMLRAPFGRMLAGVARTESAPPLYYVVAWVWVRVFGDGQAGLRSLSAVAGLATVPAAFAATRLLVGRRVALIAAALLAVNPLLIWYSQEARAYALLVLASTVALWMFARARERPTPGRLAAWALAAAAAMWTHYFAAFLVIPEAVLLLPAVGRPRRPLLLAVGGLGAATVPLVVLAASQSHHAAWIGTLSLRLRVEQVARSFVDGFTPPAGRAVALVSAAIVVAALVLAALGGDRAERRRVSAIAVIGAVALALPLLAIGVGLDFFDGRNTIAGVVPLTIVLAAGFGARRRLVVGLPLAGALVVLSVALVARVWTDTPAQRPDWPALAAALRRLPSPRVIRLDGGSRSWALPLTFELRRTWWVTNRGARVRELDVVRRLPMPGTCARGIWWGAACDMPELPAPRRPPLPQLHLVATIEAGGFAIARYRAARPVLIYPHGRAARRVHRRRHPKRQFLLTPAREPVVE